MHCFPFSSQQGLNLAFAPGWVHINGTLIEISSLLISIRVVPKLASQISVHKVLDMGY
jgi:hypothetical protein